MLFIFPSNSSIYTKAMVSSNQAQARDYAQQLLCTRNHNHQDPISIVTSRKLIIVLAFPLHGTK